MQSLLTLTRYGLIALVIAILGGLGAWYFILQSSTKAAATSDDARGLNTSVPTFSDGSRGSTASNIAARYGAGPSNAETTNASASTNISSSTSSPVSAEKSSAALSATLWHAEKTPVAGFAFSTSRDSIHVFFVQRATGYIFSGNPGSGSVVRLTNTLVPKTAEAVVAGDGSAILRSINALGAIHSFAGTPTISSSSESRLLGRELDNGIQAITIDPGSKELFYIENDPTGGTAGFLADWNAAKPRKVFSSPVGSWRPILLADGRMFILQSPADDDIGYAYEIDKNGAWSLLAQAPGLTILPRASSTALLYSSSQGGSLSLYARPSVQATVVKLPIRTIAEKCAWAPTALLIAYCAVPTDAPVSGFLGNWYRGVLHTGDEWWRVDVGAGTATKLPSPKNNLPDVIDPAIDPSGKYLAYIDNTDHSLWMMNLTQ